MPVRFRKVQTATTPSTVKSPFPLRPEEPLRLLLKATTIKEAEQARDQFKLIVLTADLPEAWRLWNTIETWWPEILVLITTRVTNARTEAANTSIKQIKRTGRGYRNHHHYRARILLTIARSTRRRRTLNQQATAFNCG
jgi:transposase